MHGTPKASLDVIIEISKHLKPKDRLTLSLTRKELHLPIHTYMLRHIIFDQDHSLATEPLLCAIKDDNVPLLSTIYDLVQSNTRQWHCHSCVRDWNWYLGLSHNLFLEAVKRSRSKCLEFLLDTVGDSCKVTLSGELGCVRGYRYCTTPKELLKYAISIDAVECVNVILDRPHLFDLVGMPRPNLSSEFDNEFQLRHKLSAPVAESLIDHGVKFIPGALSFLNRYDGEYNVDLCRVLVKKGGLDVDYVNTFGETALFEACRDGNATAVETLLQLGANANGVGKEKLGTANPRLTRPIDILLKSGLWRHRNWHEVGTVMYRCIKALLEHGASTCKARFAAHPIQKLLDNIWILLCPCARVAAGVGESDEASLDQLLEALLTVDIRPFDKLCDMVVDADASYSAMAEGLRGKQRLAKLLSQQKNPPLRFNWKERDYWVFSGKGFKAGDVKEELEVETLPSYAKPLPWRPRKTVYICLYYHDDLWFPVTRPRHDDNHIVPYNLNPTYGPEGNYWYQEPDW
ncbi:hypothetical protein F5Y06DRAFT_305940 [Hypoxylon sp. FL0890]|nr:hypothetical protein F5Y06DRAFT_305940 [Hypoxylon sp. FL0890]